VQDFVQLAPGVVVGDRIVVNLRVAAVEIVIIAGTATPDSLRVCSAASENQALLVIGDRSGVAVVIIPRIMSPFVCGDFAPTT
jgi:hypothetical protein